MVRKTYKFKDLIKTIVDYLSGYFDIEEIILFGSQATGKTHRYSDIDLAVISSDFEKKNIDNLLKIFSKISLEITPNVEIHPFTPKDIKEARPSNFIGHILSTGKVVYRHRR